MIATLRYDKGMGNAALYCRARNAAGQHWDWTDLVWTTEIAATKKYLTELPDSDTFEARYQASLSVPSGDTVLEYVEVSTGFVVAEEVVVGSSNDLLKRIAGLLGANKIVDQEVLDSKLRVTSARMRVFDRSPTDPAAVVLGTYNVSAAYAASGACTMTVAEVLS